MRILLISLTLLFVAAPTGQGQPYGALSAGGLAYRGSVLKENGAYVSGYLAFSYPAWLQTEISATQTWIRYRDNTQLNQQEGFASFTLYPRTGRWLRAGFHAIQTSDPLTRGSTTFFVGGGIYQPYRWHVGVTGYWTRYPSYEPEMLQVFQIEPVVGRSMFELYTNRTLQATLIPRMILLDQRLTLGKQVFYSLELQLTYQSGPWRIESMLWSGEQVFALRGYGAVVFNLPEKHTGGYAFGLRYPANRTFQGALHLYVEQFRDIGFDEDVRVLVPTITLSYRHTP